MVQTDDESKLKTEQENSFVDFKSTLKTLFWAVFCMSPVESADVIIENLPGERESETIINQHNFTEFIGYLAFASEYLRLFRWSMVRTKKIIFPINYFNILFVRFPIHFRDSCFKYANRLYGEYLYQSDR